MKIFERWLGINRYLYNSALEHRITAYKSTKVSITKYEQYNELPQIKKDLPFVALVYSDVLQETLDRVDKAFKAFFRGSGFPRFQGKKFYTSFTFKRNISVQGNYIKLPKIGLVKFFNSREIPGEIKTATIKKQIDGWCVCISAKIETQPITIDNSHAIGIDKGISIFAATSDCKKIITPLFLEPTLCKMRVLQRKLARQKKGSNSREKTKIRIAKLHLKIARQRNDFLHKVSTQIAQEYSACYVEDLKIKNMTKLNSTLSRRLLDSGFYNFRLLLKYKFEFRGNTFLAVPPHYTSQTCNVCGYTDKENRTSQSKFKCSSCGHTDNADINAAKNIKAKGISFVSKRKAVA